MYSELADEEMKFYQYFRMSKHQFNYLLQKIEKYEYCFPRRNRDGGIFARSKLGKYLETYLDIPEDKQLPGTLFLAPYIIVGDEACPVAYPGILFGGKVQQIQLWTEGRENGDLRVVAP